MKQNKLKPLLRIKDSTMKSKQQKQQEAQQRLLNALGIELESVLRLLQDERESRARLQCQFYKLIEPNDAESALSLEAYNLRIRLSILEFSETEF